MINGFSRITVAVSSLPDALREYSALLGKFGEVDTAVLLPLSNVAIALEQDTSVPAPVIRGLELWGDAPTLPPDCRGLPLSIATERQVRNSLTSTGISGVDHIVLRSRDASDCIRLFGDKLGMRLALDQDVPEWGGRMLFFRCGKMTLEVIQHLDEPVAEDCFWGITYLCPDLAYTLECLDAAGVENSGARPGRKPGTAVATVKSHNLGIPTLLIQPA
jgi:catechol 2,3-dioxygenase-like lactoylglutathione lyase family enzyme